MQFLRLSFQTMECWVPLLQLERPTLPSMSNMKHQPNVDLVSEPIDGHHILYAFQEIAKVVVLNGELSEAEFSQRFEKRPATVVMYDEETFYMAESRRINVTIWKGRPTVMWVRTCKKFEHLWEFFGRPKSKDRRAHAMAKRAKF